MNKIKLDSSLMTEEMRKRIRTDDSVYEELDVEASLPYIILELKWGDRNLNEENKKRCSKAEEIWKTKGGLIFNKIYDMFKDKTAVEKEYFGDVFMSVMSAQLIEWGFTFIADFTYKAHYK